MFDQFSYSEKSQNEYVHYMIVGSENGANNCDSLSEVMNIYEN